MKYGFTTTPRFRVTVPGNHATQEQEQWIRDLGSPGTYNYDIKGFFTENPYVEWNFSREVDAVAFRLKYK